MRDYPQPQGKWNRTQDDAVAPRWSPDGRYVDYWIDGLSIDTLKRVRIDRRPSIVVHAPEIGDVRDLYGLGNWDLHPDGRRFLVTVPVTLTPRSDGGKTQAPSDATSYSRISSAS